MSPDWSPAAPLPADYQGRIAPALQAADDACRPATRKEFAVAIHDLVEWLEVFGVVPLPTDPGRRENRITQIVGRYQHDLADLPPDLLRDAIRQVTRSAEYRVLPLPGDIRKTIAPELERRRHALRRLATAQRLARFEGKPNLRAVPSPEEQAEAQRLAAEATANLAGAEIPEWRKSDPNERDKPPGIPAEVLDEIKARPRIPMPHERKAAE